MCGCKVNLSMLSCLAVLPPSHTSTKGKQAASKLAHLSGAPNQPDTLGLSLFLCVCMFIPGTPLLLPPRAQHNHTWPHTDSNCRSLFHCRTSNQRREQHTEHTHYFRTRNYSAESAICGGQWERWREKANAFQANWTPGQQTLNWCAQCEGTTLYKYNLSCPGRNSHRFSRKKACPMSTNESVERLAGKARTISGQFIGHTETPCTGHLRDDLWSELVFQQDAGGNLL